MSVDDSSKESMTPKVTKTKKEPEKETEVIPAYRFLMQRGTGICEAVKFTAKDVFLCFDLSTKKFHLQDEFPDDIKEAGSKIKRYVTRPANNHGTYHMSTEMWQKIQLLTEPFPLKEMYEEVLGYNTTYLDIENEFRILLTLQTIETYIQNKFGVLGYLFFKGEPGSGKTNACLIINGCGYRSLMVIIANSANLYYYIGTEAELE
jgi:hypothetical protein